MIWISKQGKHLNNASTYKVGYWFPLLMLTFHTYATLTMPIFKHHYVHFYIATSKFHTQKVTKHA